MELILFYLKAMSKEREEWLALQTANLFQLELLLILLLTKLKA